MADSGASTHRKMSGSLSRARLGVRSLIGGSSTPRASSSSNSGSMTERGPISSQSEKERSGHYAGLSVQPDGSFACHLGSLSPNEVALARDNFAKFDMVVEVLSPSIRFSVRLSPHETFFARRQYIIFRWSTQKCRC